MKKFDIGEIERKVAKLKKAGDNLKKHFVGNNDIIDKIISEIEFWYVCPELLNRPPIICLWGMTGVGKTDLVRRLVVELDIDDKFLEIQMTNKGSGNTMVRSDSISAMLQNSPINEEEQGVLLLDEMQRFRTVEEEKEIHDYKYQDVWTLLSDGKFSKQAKDIEAEIYGMILDSKISIEREEIRQENAKAGLDEDGEVVDEEDVEKSKKARKSKYVQWRYFAGRLKSLLNLEESIVDIAQWDDEKVLTVLIDKLEDKTIYKAQDYSRLLIFISGNLDEVYSNAHSVEEVDLDADIFHEITRKITLVSVKKALTRRFKPEQIARFGNVHIIYPSISKRNYEVIIERSCSDLIDSFQDASGLKINIDQSVYDFIYRNAVFPLQGTRPVFSTIFSLINNNLTKMVYFAIKKKSKSLSVSYDSEKCQLIGSNKRKSISLSCEGDVDRIKRKKREKDSDRKFSTIIHEAGHNVVYTALFGYVPRSIAIETASDDFSGFIYPECLVYSKANIEKEIAVILAGRAAERIVFGADRITIGASEDYRTATIKAGRMVRKWMLFDREAQIVPIGTVEGDHSFFNHDDAQSNAMIEEIMINSAKQADKTLRENLDILRQLSIFIQGKKKVNSQEIKEFYDSIGVEAKVLKTNGVIKAGVEESYHTFLKGSGLIEERLVADSTSKTEDVTIL